MVAPLVGNAGEHLIPTSHGTPRTKSAAPFEGGLGTAAELGRRLGTLGAGDSGGP